MGSGQSSCHLPETEAGGSVAKLSQVKLKMFTINSQRVGRAERPNICVICLLVTVPAPAAQLASNICDVETM